ncbi:MAG: hypothetical protein HY678_02845 [Chloroflexi bacterium]|nr:hypothetical protein [Chloroflexota bacterium]
MHEKCSGWLRQTFCTAFHGVQRELYEALHKHGLEFENKPYDNVWRQLQRKYGDDGLADVIRKELAARLTRDGMQRLRDWFWNDTVPSIDDLRKLDPTNHRCWADRVSGEVEGTYTEYTVAWSAFANLWFQCLDPDKPARTRERAPARPGGYLDGIDDPAPMFDRWLRLHGARVEPFIDLPPDTFVAVAPRTNVYVFRYWSAAQPPNSPAGVEFVESLVKTGQRVKEMPVARGKTVEMAACCLAGFTDEALEYARQNSVRLWGPERVVSEWLRSASIGIAHDHGRWYIVGAGSDRPRSHLTPKRRVRYD